MIETIRAETGSVRCGPIHEDVAHDSRLHGNDAGNFVEPSHDRKRCALERDKDLREARVGVKALACRPQRIERGYGRYKHGDAGRDHERDGYHLAAQRGNVAEQVSGREDSPADLLRGQPVGIALLTDDSSAAQDGAPDQPCRRWQHYG